MGTWSKKHFTAKVVVRTRLSKSVACLVSLHRVVSLSQISPLVRSNSEIIKNFDQTHA